MGDPFKNSKTQEIAYKGLPESYWFGSTPLLVLNCMWKNRVLYDWVYEDANYYGGESFVYREVGPSQANRRYLLTKSEDSEHEVAVN